MTLNEHDYHDPADFLPGTIVLQKVYPDEVAPRTWLIIGRSIYETKYAKYVSGLLTMGHSTKLVETLLVSRADVKAGSVVVFEPEERGK